MSTCKQHHVNMDGSPICPICEHRSNYMVHGNVTLFDQGYKDGWAGLADKAKKLAKGGHYADAASYQDGWKIGKAQREARPTAKQPRAKKCIPRDKFGRDHWSVFAYIETLCVEKKGIPDRNRMRTNAQRHPGLVGSIAGAGTLLSKWNPKHSTRLKGHTADKPVQANGHDDWDCADDLEAAGLLEIKGSGIHPVFALTDLGVATASSLREHKQKGGSFSNFEL